MKIGAVEFTQTKYSSFDGKTKVAFTEVTDSDKPFTLVATPQGVEIAGFHMSSMDDLQDFAKLVSQVWKEHKKLEPKIERSASGH